MELIQEQERWQEKMDELQKTYMRQSEIEGLEAGPAQISDQQADFIRQSRSEQYVSPLALSLFQFDKYDEDLKYSDAELDSLMLQYNNLNEQIKNLEVQEDDQARLSLLDKRNKVFNSQKLHQTVYFGLPLEKQLQNGLNIRALIWP